VQLTNTVNNIVVTEARRKNSTWTYYRSSTWDLNFNTKKCVALRFSRRKTSAPTQGYVLNQKPIKFAATQNDLGILVSNDLRWSSHVINIVAKDNRMLGFLRRNCFHLTDVNTRRLLYLSQPRSQALSSCGGKTLVGAGHVIPRILGVNWIWSQGGVVEESVCCVWKIATLCLIISGDKNVICNKRLWKELFYY
jgi:hypothetical protein